MGGDNGDAIHADIQDPLLSIVPSATLSARDLEITRGDRCLFNGLDVELGAGELALVTGPNGAGKTTLLRTLGGLRPPSSGTVTYGGIDVARLARGPTASVAFQGHLDGLKRDLTVEENLRFVADLWGRDESRTVLAGELGLEDSLGRQVRHLSAGQRRRVALGCLRLRRAALWLLDEPTTNLDGAGAALVSTWLDRHLLAGGAAIVATHQPEMLADRATLEIGL